MQDYSEIAMAAQLEAEILFKREIIKSLDKGAHNYEDEKKRYEEELKGLERLFNGVQQRQRQDSADDAFHTKTESSHVESPGMDWLQQISQNGCSNDSAYSLNAASKIFENPLNGHDYSQSSSSRKRYSTSDDYYDGIFRSKRRKSPIAPDMSSYATPFATPYQASKNDLFHYSPEDLNTTDGTFEKPTNEHGYSQSDYPRKRTPAVEDDFADNHTSKRRRTSSVTPGMSSWTTPTASPDTQAVIPEKQGRPVAEQARKNDHYLWSTSAQYQDDVKPQSTSRKWSLFESESDEQSFPTPEPCAPPEKSQKGSRYDITGLFSLFDEVPVESHPALWSFARSPSHSGDFVDDLIESDMASEEDKPADPFADLDKLYTGRRDQPYAPRSVVDPFADLENYYTGRLPPDYVPGQTSVAEIAKALYRRPPPLGPVHPEIEIDPAEAKKYREERRERLEAEAARRNAEARRKRKRKTNKGEDDFESDEEEESKETEEEKKKNREELKKLYANIHTHEETLPEGIDGTPEAFNLDMMPHQLLGLDWMKKNEESDQKGGILADGMGLGKTLQAIALMVTRPSDDPRKKTTLVVTPFSLLDQWKEEIEARIEADHALKVKIYHDAASTKLTFRELSRYDVVLTSYDKLSSEFNRRKDGKGYHKHERQARLARQGEKKTPIKDQLSLLGDECEWYRVILDEAHYIKNRETVRSKATCALKATYRLCLTGTPIQNNISELYGLVKFLRVQPYTDWKKFERDIVLPLRSDKTKVVDEAERKVKLLVKAILKQRTMATKIDGKPIMEMPEKEIRISNIDFSDNHLAFYKIYKEAHRKSMRGVDHHGRADAAGFIKMMAAMQRRRQAASHPLLCKNFDTETPQSELKATDMLQLAKKLRPEAVQSIKAKLVDDRMLPCPHCKDPAVLNPVFNRCGHYSCLHCFSVQVEKQEGCGTCQAPISAGKAIDFPAFKRAHMAELSESDKKSGGFQDEYVEKHMEKNARKPGDKSALTLAQLRDKRRGPARNKYIDFLTRQYVPSAKVDETIRILSSIRQTKPGDKTLVFSEWTSMLDILEIAIREEGWEVSRYDGDATKDERAKALAHFKTTPSCTIMLTSLGAGNVGLNLNAANHVILHEPCPNPFKEEQAIGRAYRKGQLKKVVVYKLVMAGHENIEQEMVEKAHRKKMRMADMALDVSGKANVTAEEIEALLAE